MANEKADIFETNSYPSFADASEPAYESDDMNRNIALDVMPLLLQKELLLKEQKQN